MTTFRNPINLRGFKSSRQFDSLAIPCLPQERITELEARRDAMLQGDAAIPKKTVADAPPQSPLTVGGEVSVPFNFPGGGIAKHGISEPFWQECGGRQPS